MLLCLQPVSVWNKLWSTTEGNELLQTITAMDIYSEKSIEVSKTAEHNIFFGLSSNPQLFQSQPQVFDFGSYQNNRNNSSVNDPGRYELLKQ